MEHKQTKKKAKIRTEAGEMKFFVFKVLDCAILEADLNVFEVFLESLLTLFEVGGGHIELLLGG